MSGQHRLLQLISYVLAQPDDATELNHFYSNYNSSHGFQNRSVNMNETTSPYMTFSTNQTGLGLRIGGFRSNSCVTGS